MRSHAQPVSRRWFIGAGAAIACAGQPQSAQAQAASDGFRPLHARALGSGPSSGSSGLGYDGVVPGPTLRVRRGEELRVRLVNDLPAATSVHWHGIRLPNAMDGVPQLTQPAVAPGASFDYRFPAARCRHVLVPRLRRRPGRSRPRRSADRRGGAAGRRRSRHRAGARTSAADGRAGSGQRLGAPRPRGARR